MREKPEYMDSNDALIMVLEHTVCFHMTCAGRRPANAASSAAIPHDDLREQCQASVKEMLAAGHDDDRHLLRPRPIEHRLEWHDLVVLPVHYQRIGGHAFGRKTIDRRS